MAVCNYYLRGQCRFGASCRNEHPADKRQPVFGSTSNTWSSSGGTGNQPIFPVSLDTMTKDLEPAPTGEKPLWPLSTYGPAKHEPNISPPLDESFEELRFKAHQAASSNAANDYLKYEGEKTSAANDYYTAAHGKAKELYEHAKKQTTAGGTKSPSIPPTPYDPTQRPAFASSSSAFGAPQNPGSSAFGASNTGSAFGNSANPAFNKQSVFGGASSFGQSAFGQPTPSAFSQPTSSAFGQPTSSAFGQPTSSAFGQPPQPQPQPSAFGLPPKPQPQPQPQLQPQPSAFGLPPKPAVNAFNQQQSGFGQQTSVFGQPSLQQPTSAFGQPTSALAPQPSAFGASAFGKLAAYGSAGFASTSGTGFAGFAGSQPSAFATAANTSSAFGQPTPPQAPQSSFSQPTSAFAQPTASSAFSSAPAPASVFGSAPALAAAATTTLPSASAMQKSRSTSGKPDFEAAFASAKGRADVYDALLPPNYIAILPEKARACFESASFDWATGIPDWIPPVELR